MIVQPGLLKSSVGNLILPGQVLPPTNVLADPTFTGAAAGSPGTLPTGWSHASPSSGVSREIVGFGTYRNRPTMLFRLSGTFTASTGTGILFNGLASSAALAGQTWVQEIWMRIAAGTLTTNTWRLRVRGTDGVAQVENQTVDTINFINAGWQKFRTQRTLNAGTTTHVNGLIEYNYTSDVSIDVTIEMCYPQLYRIA